MSSSPRPPVAPLSFCRCARQVNVLKCIDCGIAKNLATAEYVLIIDSCSFLFTWFLGLVLSVVPTECGSIGYIYLNCSFSLWQSLVLAFWVNWLLRSLVPLVWILNFLSQDLVSVLGPTECGSLFMSYKICFHYSLGQFAHTVFGSFINSNGSNWFQWLLA